MKSCKCSKTEIQRNPQKKKKEDEEGETGSRCDNKENLTDIE